MICGLGLGGLGLMSGFRAYGCVWFLASGVLRTSKKVLHWRV